MHLVRIVLYPPTHVYFPLSTSTQFLQSNLLQLALLQDSPRHKSVVASDICFLLRLVIRCELRIITNNSALVVSYFYIVEIQTTS